MEDALLADAPEVHDVRQRASARPHPHGDPDTAKADVWVEGYYETPMQDQAALGPEGALAVPAADGGVEPARRSPSGCTSTGSRSRRASTCPRRRCGSRSRAWAGRSGRARTSTRRSTPACSRCARAVPVKMAYGREESFHGHVHRHPSRTWIRYGATRDGRLVAADVRLLLDGGAYASSSPAVLANASTFAAGPYEVPNVRIEGTVVYTNNPPCGAMRGFGAPQVCFAYESAMDALAAKLGDRPGRAPAEERRAARARCCRPGRCWRAARRCAR